MELAKRTAVIGLGGGGLVVVSELREQFPQAAEYLTLDVDSEIFGVFYRGYLSDVIPPIQAWARTEGGNVCHWLDLTSPFSPLRDLPDIFLRNTTRPVMKASLLMQRTRVKAFLAEALEAPDEVILTTTLTGATGSAWILEVAKILKELFPTSNFRLVLTKDTEERYSSSISVERALANSFWTLKEIDSESAQTLRPEVVPTFSMSVSRIAHLLSRSYEEDDKSNNVTASSALFEISQRIKSSFNGQFASMALLNSRADSLSRVLTHDEWCALVGLLLAFAEERVERESTRNEACWNFVVFRSRLDGRREVIAVPNVGAVASELVGLAHSHHGFGSEEHQCPYETLSQEGSAALAGLFAPIDADTVDRLVEIRDSMKRRLDQVSEVGIRDSSQRYFVDLYPELLRLIDQLLITNEIEK